MYLIKLNCQLLYLQFWRLVIKKVLINSSINDAEKFCFKIFL